MNHLLTSNAYLHYLKYLGIGCTLMCAVSTQFRASPFERALLSALNQVLLIN